MTITTIFLILISGLGVLHGLFLSPFLWNYKKGVPAANKILALLLLVLTFRVGKSVFLAFAEQFDVKLIFIGLSFITAIGPLFYFYVQAVLHQRFSWKTVYLLHFLPVVIGVAFGVWMDQEKLNTLPKAIFALVFAFYYLHLLCYLFVARYYFEKKIQVKNKTKAIAWLRTLFYALLAIWVVYVLNILDEVIPYIFGPILYSIVAYGISFLAIRKNYLDLDAKEKYKTTPVSKQQMEDVFSKVESFVLEGEEYKNPDISLKSLSSAIKVSPQILSLVINSRANNNFNGYINQHRIAAAKQLFLHEKYAQYTIAAIAFEVGFNSITSFNKAFKKYTGTTPLQYKNDHFV